MFKQMFIVAKTAYVLCLLQGVVTPISFVDTFATGIKAFDHENNALITWLHFYKGFDSWSFAVNAH